MAFDLVMTGQNQIDKKLEMNIGATDLLTVPHGSITETGLRTNVNVTLQYLESWLRGVGCVPLNNLMEDAATAEISRAQIWQWIRHPRSATASGTKITEKMFLKVLDEEMDRIAEQIGPHRIEMGNFTNAKEIFRRVVQNDEFTEFITLPAYDYLE